MRDRSFGLIIMKKILLYCLPHQPIDSLFGFLGIFGFMRAVVVVVEALFLFDTSLLHRPIYIVTLDLPLNPIIATEV